MTTYEYSVAQVLNITDGNLFTDMDDVRGILNWTKGDKLKHYELPSAAASARVMLFHLWPELKEMRLNNVDVAFADEIMSEFVQKVEQKLGVDHFDVPQLREWRGMRKKHAN